jgi:hypothetical protein
MTTPNLAGESSDFQRLGGIDITSATMLLLGVAEPQMKLEQRLVSFMAEKQLRTTDLTWHVAA